MVRIEVGGPWFEDLKVGDVYDDAPAMTVTPGHIAFFQAAVGDRARLPLDRPLSMAVTGHAAPLVPHGLVCNIAIGQTTLVTQRVRANLFYRGLIQLRPVYVGDTLRTRTEVVGLKQNARRESRPATGLVALKVSVANQHGSPVLDFWRCPMIPLRDPSAQTDRADDFDDIPADLDEATLLEAVPPWRFSAFRDAVQGPHLADLQVGTTYVVEAREVVTAAPELVRMTLNMAEIHLDPDASAYGRPLVYGGHTISLAAAQITRALPNLITVLAWRSCDHRGPVFEGDLLRTEVDVEGIRPLDGDGGLVDLRASTYAARAAAGETSGEEMVLDWRLVALMA